MSPPERGLGPGLGRLCAARSSPAEDGEAAGSWVCGMEPWGGQGQGPPRRWERLA